MLRSCCLPPRLSRAGSLVAMAPCGARPSQCAALAFAPALAVHRGSSFMPRPPASRWRLPVAAGADIALPGYPLLCCPRRIAAVAVVAGPDGAAGYVGPAVADADDSAASVRPVLSLGPRPYAAVASDAVPAEAEKDVLPAPIKWINGVAVGLAVGLTDRLFAGKEPVRRFWVLEVVARCPYFSYLCVLHCYESLGLRSRSSRLTSRLRAHFAEADNEAMHTQVMEDLGGGTAWGDRFIAQHVALVYFWLGVAIFAASPAAAYDFNRRVEEHAFHTYDEFLRSGAADAWRDVPAPDVATEYYAKVDCLTAEGLSVSPSSPSSLEADELCTPVASLYDVFVRIRDDEAHHAESLSSYGRQRLG